MAKFGRKNHVNLDPLSYSSCLLGEAKVGKTTLVRQVCEKLVGEDGYMFLELGQERGADAIEGINYVNCPEWNMEVDELTNSAGFADVCEDIIENKSTEYAALKVVVWDTYDQLITIAEQEAIRLWNKECRENQHPEKCTKSINAAWGGFGKKLIRHLHLTSSRIISMPSRKTFISLVLHILTEQLQKRKQVRKILLPIRKRSRMLSKTKRERLNSEMITMQ